MQFYIYLKFYAHVVEGITVFEDVEDIFKNLPMTGEETNTHLVVRRMSAKTFGKISSFH